MALLSPDLSRMVSLETEIDYVKMPIFLQHFQQDDKHLYYVGTQHGIKNTQINYETINRTFEEASPQFMIVEGVDTQEGVTPERYTKLSKAEQRGEFASEAGYAAHLAVQAGVPFIGGETTMREMADYAVTKGFTAKDVVGVYTMMRIQQSQRGAHKANSSSVDLCAPRCDSCILIIA